MLGLMPVYGTSTVGDTRPDVVLVQALVERESSVTLDPDRPWQRFVDELDLTRKFQRHHLSEVRRVFAGIRERVGDRLSLPLTQPTSEGAVQLAWESKDRRYVVDVDVFDDGTLHWYFRDRTTNETDGTEDERVRGFPGDLIERLVLVLAPT